MESPSQRLLDVRGVARTLRGIVDNVVSQLHATHIHSATPPTSKRCRVRSDAPAAVISVCVNTPLLDRVSAKPTWAQALFGRSAQHSAKIESVSEVAASISDDDVPLAALIAPCSIKREIVENVVSQLRATHTHSATPPTAKRCRPAALSSSVTLRAAHDTDSEYSTNRILRRHRKRIRKAPARHASAHVRQQS